jgi:hypothetical protein
VTVNAHAAGDKSETAPICAGIESHPVVGRVLLIDDAVAGLGAEWHADDDRWKSFILSLGEDLETALDAGKVEELRTAVDRKEALRQIGTLLEKKKVEATLGLFDDGRELIESWIRNLKAFQGSVVLASGRGDLDRLAGSGASVRGFVCSFDLILLDFELVPGDGGRASMELAKYLASSVLECDSPETTPILVKFSRLAVEQREEERSEFAREVNYPRGCYQFLAKTEVNDELMFERLVAGLIENGRFGRQLLKVARDVRHTLSSQLEKHVGDMLTRDLDPTAARRMFDRRLRPEGMSELDYLIWLTTNLFISRVRESDEVARDVQSFLKAIDDMPLEAQPADPTGLATLEVAIRYDRSVNRFRRPIDFGDIFVFEDGRTDGCRTVGLVLSQQCDLMVRGKADSVGLGSEPWDWLSICLGEWRGDEAGQDGRFSETGDPPFESISWTRFEVLSMPRPVFDLVTLSDDGRARIPDEVIRSPWWTSAYAEFISSQLGRVRSATRVADEAKHIHLHLPGVVPAERSAFGIGLDLLLLSDGELPLRRLCRLRWVDTMAHLQQSLAKAGRVGLDVSANDRVSTEIVRVFGDRGELKSIEARVTRFDGNATNVDVESAELRQIVSSASGYQPLASETADYWARFNLLKAAARLGFRLIPQGKVPNQTWELRLPDKPSVGGSKKDKLAVASSQPTFSRPTQRSSTATGNATEV